MRVGTHRWSFQLGRASHSAAAIDILRGEIMSGRHHLIGHRRAGVGKKFGQPVALRGGHQRIGGAGQDQHRQSGERRQGARHERHHGAHQHRAGQRLRLRQQQRGGDIGAVGKSDRHRLADAVMLARAARRTRPARACATPDPRDRTRPRRAGGRTAASRSPRPCRAATTAPRPATDARPARAGRSRRRRCRAAAAGEGAPACVAGTKR